MIKPKIQVFFWGWLASSWVCLGHPGHGGHGGAAGHTEYGFPGMEAVVGLVLLGVIAMGLRRWWGGQPK